MATTIQTHESEVAMALDLTNLLALVLVVDNLEILQLGSSKLLLARPLESFSPGLVAKPVADKVSITSINQNWNLLEETRNKEVERLHPVTMEEEIAVNVHIARIIATNFSTQGLHDVALVEIFGDVFKDLVAQSGAFFTLLANVVNILAGALVRADKGIVAVNGSRNTSPSAVAVIAVSDHRLAARQGIVHGLAGAFV